MGAMDKMSAFLEEKFMPIAGKIGEQKHLQSIRDGILMTMPFLIVGSVFLVLGFIPIPGYNEFMAGIFGDAWRVKLMYPVRVTFDLMAIVGCLGISYRLCEKYKVDAFSGALIALVSFMLVTPFTIDTPNGTVGGIPIALMGSKGLFVAMIMAILSTEVYRVIIQKDITIKMPSSVPPAVAKSFTALIPAAVIILISFVIRLAFEASPFESIHYVVAKLLVKPLTAISGSYLGIVVQTVLISLLWSAGIHGSSIVTGVMAPVFATMLDQNRMAFEAGQEIPNILTEQFMALYPKLGGSGCTLALALFMLFKARSKQLKEIGKLSVGPALFNINEPVIFGMPIVMNPILIIPFILAPVAAVSVAYWGMKLGLASKLVGIAVPWTSPIGLGPYIASGGAISAVILQLASFAVSGAIYYPFFKIWDSIKFKEEALEEAMELEISEPEVETA